MSIRGKTSESPPAKDMKYKVFFTRFGQGTYYDCIGYIRYHFKDEFAARNLENDVQHSIDILETSPKSYPVCENDSLNRRRIRKIHLSKHKYKIFYRIVSKNEVHIDAILHDRQDFENILK